MMTVSGEAFSELQRRFLDLGFRITVKGNERGRHTISMKLDRQSQEDEIVWLGGIVKILLDPASVAKAEGHELHYLDEPHGKFVLRKQQSTAANCGS